MKRIIIIGEGQTEQAFTKTVLYPYFMHKNIIVSHPTIKHSNGGIVKWGILKDQIEKHLISDSTAYVTTLIDYYGCYKKHNFPDWELAESNSDKNTTMEIIENGMKQGIDESIRHRFLPYIQLHEFEGLLFNDIEIFKTQIPPEDLVGLRELEKIFLEFDNPEMINSSRETSPSHRLERIIKGYSKVVYGDILSDVIGIENIKSKCPRFREWIAKMESIDID